MELKASKIPITALVKAFQLYKCCRGRCLCKCGFKQEGSRCVELPPPSTTTSQPAVIVPGIAVPPGGELFKLIGNFFGGTARSSAFPG
ncbi:hypothetical protein Tcan_04402 [Toxocara canis]|uniref:Uncharacterized protein n=1 Tax=Toxocara canis TaxID=6265 RepID=A0A0B2VFG8_TOXCA|nr:hypothetical protein Tcan_04402 [Toxocara canis]